MQRRRWQFFGVAFTVAMFTLAVAYFLAELRSTNPQMELEAVGTDLDHDPLYVDSEILAPTYPSAILTSADPLLFQDLGEVVSALDISFGADEGVYIARVISPETQHPAEMWTASKIPIQLLIRDRAVDGWYSLRWRGWYAFSLQVDSGSSRGFAVPISQYFIDEGFGINLALGEVRGEVWVKLIGSKLRDWPHYLETRVRIDRQGILTILVLDGSAYPADPGKPIMEQPLVQPIPADRNIQLQMARINEEIVIGLLNSSGSLLGFARIPTDVIPRGSIELEIEGTPGSSIELNRAFTIRPRAMSSQLFALEYGRGESIIVPVAFDREGNLRISALNDVTSLDTQALDEQRLIVSAEGIVILGEGDNIRLTSMDIDDFNQQLMTDEVSVHAEVQSTWYETLTQEEMTSIASASQHLLETRAGGTLIEVPLSRIDNGPTTTGSSGLVTTRKFIFGVVLENPSIEAISLIDYDGNETQIDVYAVPYLMQTRGGEYLVKRLVLGSVVGRLMCFNNPGGRVRTGGAGTRYGVPLQNAAYLLTENVQHGMRMSFWNDEELEQQLLAAYPGNEEYRSRMLLNRMYGQKTQEFLKAVQAGEQASQLPELTHLFGAEMILLNVGESANSCSG